MQDWSLEGQLLTGTPAPAREEFLATLDQLVRTPTKRPRAHLGALAVVDVDSFDQANQRLGHRAGDRLLNAVAATLDGMVTAVPGHPLVARIGGDEFGILAPGTTAQALADRIRALPNATAALHAEHGTWAPTVSVGISGVVAGEIIDQPLARAEQALTQAKSLGRARIQVYDASTHQFAIDRHDMFVHLAALKELIARLRAEMRTDALTQVGNRIALDEYLSELEVADAASSAVLFVDIDRFHSFNHAQGQEAGDEALRQVAAALALTSRTADHLFRRGGEEFVIVLPNTTGSDALRVAERHRRAVADLAIPHGGTEQTPIVTITICVATATSGTLSAAIERAARTAFAAKDRKACNVVLDSGGAAPQVGARRDQ